MLEYSTWHTVCVWIDPIALCEPLTIHHLCITRRNDFDIAGIIVSAGTAPNF